MSDDQFREFASAKGLRGIGGEATIEQLKRQYGGARWFDFLDVISLPPAPLLDGMTQRWRIRDDATCLLPPVRFDCDFDGGRGAERNHAMALEGLSRQFGPAAEQAIDNVWSHRWRFGRVSLSILTFKREKTRSNPLYDRHPELWEFCQVTIENPWVQRISGEELARLQALGEADLLRMPAEWAASLETMGPWERGLVHAAELPVRGEMVFWRSLADGRFGWYREGFAAAFDRAWQPELWMWDIEGERGPPDYATLGLKVANPFSRGRERVDVRLLRRDGLGSLKEASAALGRFWGIGVREVRDR